MKRLLFPCLLGACLGFSPGLQARDLGLGVSGPAGLAVGAGACRVRWNLDSTDRLIDASGTTFEQNSSSSWTRPGFGLIGTWRFSPHLEAEARWISSDEGCQKLSNNLFLGGVAWRS